VIENFPKYMREFVKQRLNDNLADTVEKRTFGHGGKREGAGRPKGTIKEPKERVSLPVDLAEWFRCNPAAIEITRKMLHKRL
jgi:hypothetical protein